MNQGREYKGRDTLNVFVFYILHRLTVLKAPASPRADLLQASSTQLSCSPLPVVTTYPQTLDALSIRLRHLAPPTSCITSYRLIHPTPRHRTPASSTPRGSMTRAAADAAHSYSIVPVLHVASIHSGKQEGGRREEGGSSRERRCRSSFQYMPRTTARLSRAQRCHSRIIGRSRKYAFRPQLYVSVSRSGAVLPLPRAVVSPTFRSRGGYHPWAEGRHWDSPRIRRGVFDSLHLHQFRKFAGFEFAYAISAVCTVHSGCTDASCPSQWTPMALAPGSLLMSEGYGARVAVLVCGDGSRYRWHWEAGASRRGAVRRHLDRTSTDTDLHTIKISASRDQIEIWAVLLPVAPCPAIIDFGDPGADHRAGAAIRWRFLRRVIWPRYTPLAPLDAFLLCVAVASGPQSYQSRAASVLATLREDTNFVILERVQYPRHGQHSLKSVVLAKLWQPVPTMSESRNKSAEMQMERELQGKERREDALALDDVDFSASIRIGRCELEHV
ncbi:hypothetical protein C8R45DRAFT_1134787 [Mycena sanguinolenta]|nr:hypothetical protein C8R45DRAFT_1134787 [Mycena sanguinolenta]